MTKTNTPSPALPAALAPNEVRALAPARDRSAFSQDAWRREIAAIYAAGAQPAYVGVDGVLYAERIRPVLIEITRAEGPAALCDVVQTAHDYVGANVSILAQNARTAPKGGGYDKHDFRVVFADGTEYQGRYDLSGDETNPSLETHMRSHVTYLHDHADRLARNLGSEPEALRAETAAWLDRYEVHQPIRPVAAGADDIAAGRIVVTANYATGQ